MFIVHLKLFLNLLVETKCNSKMRYICYYHYSPKQNFVYFFLYTIFCLCWGMAIVNVAILMVRSLTCSCISDTLDTTL